MKRPDCQFYGKGGWCGKRHDQEIHLTPMGMTKRIVCVRCSDLHNRGNGKCYYYQQRKN